MISRQKTQILFVYLHVCNLHVGNSISLFGIIWFNFVDLKKNLIFSNLLKEKEESLIIIENDTNDILNFKSDVDNYLKKKKKRYFWNLLK